MIERSKRLVEREGHAMRNAVPDAPKLEIGLIIGERLADPFQLESVEQSGGRDQDHIRKPAAQTHTFETRACADVAPLARREMAPAPRRKDMGLENIGDVHCSLHSFGEVIGARLARALRP